jgi:hypothetical protein
MAVLLSGWRPATARRRSEVDGMRRIRWCALVLAAATVVAIMSPPAGAAPATTAPTEIGTAQFALRSQPTALLSVVQDLQGVLPTRSVHQVLLAANHPRGELCHATPAGTVDGFCWTPGDDENCHNVPQGITTSRDATKDHEYGSPPHQLIVVSWYYRDDCDPDAPETRSRVTLVDWDKDWTPNAYRKVLLVEPFRRTVGPSNQLDFRDIPIHAGGVMWYGDYLYVADTYAGLRVFDMRRILEVDGGGSEDEIGFNSSLGVYRAHQYQYVLPQVGRVTDIGSNPLRWSTIGLDRGTVPDSFVVAEYQTSGPVNAARFPLDYKTYQPMPSPLGIVHASQALEVHHYSINVAQLGGDREHP